MTDPTLANQNAPTIATLAAAFYGSLLTWGATAIDAPAEVEATGAAFLLAAGAVVIGRITQKFHTDPKAG